MAAQSTCLDTMKLLDAGSVRPGPGSFATFYPSLHPERPPGSPLPPGSSALRWPGVTVSPFPLDAESVRPRALLPLGTVL